jgi:hypothetical protein
MVIAYSMRKTDGRVAGNAWRRGPRHLAAAHEAAVRTTARRQRGAKDTLPGAARRGERGPC